MVFEIRSVRGEPDCVVEARAVPLPIRGKEPVVDMPIESAPFFGSVLPESASRFSPCRSVSKAAASW